jgi:hypothetical protein
MRYRWLGLLVCAPVAFFVACTLDGSSKIEGQTSGAGATGGAQTSAATGQSDGGFNPATTGGPDGSCSTQLNVDDDNDGFTDNDGDCNDCDKNVNPGAVEVATPMSGGGGSGGSGGAEPADENCNMQFDEDPIVCDTTLSLNDTSPYAAVAALGMCAGRPSCSECLAGAQEAGVLSATWMRANGTPHPPGVNTGNLDGFGPNITPREGARMMVISSGHARTPNMPGSCGNLTCYTNGAGTPPPGFPAVVPSCPGGTNINDDVALEVQVRAPTNATGYQFDFDFYSFEFPEWVCTTYNDQFIALIDPPPQGSINGNIVFDSQNNPVSVNIAFFEVCNYNPSYPQFPCALGPGELLETGFDVWNDAGATSWLVTTAPVEAGEEFKIRFAIWDTGDAAWDSTVLIDNFRWIANTGTNVIVGTNPVPE